MYFIDANTGAMLMPGQAFIRIYDHNGRNDEVRAIANRLDEAMHMTNDEDEAHDAASFLDLAGCDLELAGQGEG